MPQAVLFGAAHGWGTPWGFADLVVFAMVAGWLTVRTGGLEAAIGLHAVSNLLAFGVSAAVVDGLKTDDTAADAPWQVVAVDLTGIALYTAAVLWLAHRRTPTRTVPAPAPVPPPLPFSAAHPQSPAAYAQFPSAHPQFPAGHAPLPYVPGPAPHGGRTNARDLPPGATPTAPPPGDTTRPPH